MIGKPVGEPRHTPGLRQRVAHLVESPGFNRLIIGLIVLNGILMGMETSQTIMADYGKLLHRLDSLLLLIFMVEIGLKLFAQGGAFFRNNWNVFDFLVVAIALAPATGQFSVLRVLRILRVLRLISQFRQLRVVVEALLGSLSGIASIAGLLLVLFYVFGVIATNLFSQAFPEWFGTLGRTLYTLFQVMTLESWSMGISRPVMAVYPWAWAFFIPFILIATFTMLNLFIAIIVNSMQAIEQVNQQATRAVIEQDTCEIRVLQQEVAELRQDIQSLGRLLREQAD
jgi:voltage-gated sodium channel